MLANRARRLAKWTWYVTSQIIFIFSLSSYFSLGLPVSMNLIGILYELCTATSLQLSYTQLCFCNLNSWRKVSLQELEGT